ncbi:SDR family oxidoreductase [Corynebacterium freiburgense]|uniref:SDR family oxidoreductase n=1 Tax=Corynebacterium freiburgense TaxID=556548 RepID=UPI00040DB61A|nr:SDR family oxidoreductase [Corynebacterium freiburgense]WJZ03126.1 3-oxoacyl-[acyl-carrier-protein] reductase FabG [Corynebacterium freiburgense]
MNSPFSLVGRTAIVTGGSTGIGFGIARCLANAGASVMVAALDDQHLANITDFAKIACDVTDPVDCATAIAATVERFGGVDILAANAGAYPQASIADIDAAAIGQLTELNVGGMANMVVAALPELRRSTAGRIIVTSSITGNYTGFPGWAHYGATKAAQLGYVRTAAIELARYGITCNAVLPGNVLTPGLEELGETYIAQMARSVPSGALGTIDDIGNTVAFLASDAAKYITGQGIVIDGGQILPESPEALET